MASKRIRLGLMKRWISKPSWLLWRLV